MLSKKAAAIGRLRLRSAAALGLAGEGIGRMRLRPAIAVVPRRRRGKRRRSAAAAPVLPDDALVEILSRVPARSLCRFKCVSKAWSDLIAGRLRCTKLPKTLEGFFYVLDVNDDEIHAGGGNSDNGGGVNPNRVFNGRFINTSGRSAPLASYAFLADQPGIDEFGLFDSCNGLLLFSHRRTGDTYNSLGYIVCNPATEQWVAVPSSGWKPDRLYLFGSEESEEEDSYSDSEGNCKFTYLIFDPAVSSHFQLVEFWTDDASTVEEVHTYSSETGLWCERTSEWNDECVAFASERAFVSGMLHFSATDFEGWKGHQEIIVAVDGEGKNRRIINGPEKKADVAFLGESQGRLQCINQNIDNTRELAELSVWVLQDYDREEWVLKHTVSFLQLFGRMGCRVHYEYNVIAIHPDRNLIYYFQHWDLKLKSYDMDSKEVCTLCTLGGRVDRHHILPYVPYFAESPALATPHWNWCSKCEAQEQLAV